MAIVTWSPVEQVSLEPSYESNASSRVHDLAVGRWEYYKDDPGPLGLETAVTNGAFLEIIKDEGLTRDLVALYAAGGSPKSDLPQGNALVSRAASKALDDFEAWARNTSRLPRPNALEPLVRARMNRAPGAF